jgi:hypothetical protein
MRGMAKRTLMEKLPGDGATEAGGPAMEAAAPRGGGEVAADAPGRGLRGGTAGEGAEDAPAPRMRPSRRIVDAKSTPRLFAIDIDVPENGAAFEFADPEFQGTRHIETRLPFSEVAKLERGNANVRTASHRARPLKEMKETLEHQPEAFHLFNRGIVYLCKSATFDPKTRRLTVVNPELMSKRSGQDHFGIVDGGHTYAGVTEMMEAAEEYHASSKWKTKGEGWTPWVRVLFTIAPPENLVAGITKGVNTSTQVKGYSLDEFEGRFVWLKKTLQSHGFDVDRVTWHEGEEREWHVVEIIQRAACFLKDRWETQSPIAMYLSKNRALELYRNPETRKEFRMLQDVLTECILLPEFIQAEFSTGEVIKGRKLGKLNGVARLPKPWKRPNTEFVTEHKIDVGLLLPMAAAFRELLYVKRGAEAYAWKVPATQVFEKCGPKLYDALTTRLGRVRGVAEVARDPEFWSECQRIVMRTKEHMLGD